jgi:hypothetical protein
MYLRYVSPFLKRLFQDIYQNRGLGYSAPILRSAPQSPLPAGGLGFLLE